MRINLDETARYFLENDGFLLLCHAHPDGDTLGSATALARALKKLDKKVRVHCNDKITEDFDFLFDNLIFDDFETEHIVCIDVADEKLLGEETEKKYRGHSELCIDHHASNLHYAEKFYVEEKSASVAEIIYSLIKTLGVDITPDIASCLFTGVTTDTGCFRFSNTTERTYEIATELVKKGADSYNIITKFFETKSKNLVHLEQLALDSLQYFCNEKVALICITRDMFKKSNTDDSVTDRLANIPRQIEGVLVGITMRELENGKFKVSVRTHGDIDASAICAKLGGGGHRGAAGCTLDVPKDEAIRKLVEAVGTL